MRPRKIYKLKHPGKMQVDYAIFKALQVSHCTGTQDQIQRLVEQCSRYSRSFYEIIHSTFLNR